MFDGLSHLAVIWIFAGLGVMVILFLISGMARHLSQSGATRSSHRVSAWEGRAS